MNRLIAQLTRELKRSPVKAAVLGGGLLVAIWFWLPLLGDWFGGEADPARSVAVPAAAPAELAATPTTAASPAPAAKSVPPVDWRELASWKQSNAYTKSYHWVSENRNPFEQTESEQAIEVAEVVEEDPIVKQELAREMAAAEVASRLSALQLTSTLIMPRTSSATINGKVYRVGEPLELGQSASLADTGGDLRAATNTPQSTELEFVVRQIHAHSVTLQHGNRLIPLPLKRTTNNAITLEFR